MFDVCIPWDVFGCISITMWICTNILYTNILYTNINGHQKIKSFAVVETLTDIATVQCQAHSRDSVWAAVPERIWVQLKMGTPKIAKFIGILMMKHWNLGISLKCWILQSNRPFWAGSWYFRSQITRGTSLVWTENQTDHNKVVTHGPINSVRGNSAAQKTYPLVN